MLCRSFFVAGAMMAAIPRVTSSTGRPCRPVPIVVIHSERREIEFFKGTQPLLDLEWWAAEAVRCHFRTARWQTAIDERITHLSADAARHLWPDDSARQKEILSLFTTAQAKFRHQAEIASRMQCSALQSSGKLEELDQVAKCGGW